MKKLILILIILMMCFASFSAYAWDPGGWDNQRIPYIKKTAAPTVNDDDYGVPFLWVDETNSKFYLLIDNTAGAAIWQEVTYAGGSPTFTDITATGNIQAATYGSGANPIPDATLLGIDDGTTDQILVGGGENVIPVWTTATGTGAPVRANSPTFTGTPVAPTIDLTGVTDNNIPKMGASGFEDSAISDDGSGNVAVQSGTDSTTGFQVLDADGGTPVLNVDTVNERVSIGTAVPQSLLDVQGAAGAAGIITAATKETTVVASDELGRINFNAPLEADGTDAILPGASIWAVAEGDFAADSNATSLVFATGSSEAAAEKMRLTSTGALEMTDSAADVQVIKAVQEPGLGGRLTIGLDETARTMVIADAGDVDVDFGLGVQSDPTLTIFNNGLTDKLSLNQIGNSAWFITSGTGIVLQADSAISLQMPNDTASGSWTRITSGTNIELIDTDGEQSWLYVEPKINQSSTASYNGLQIKVTETALGDGSTGTGATNNLIVAGTSVDADMFKVDNSGAVSATSFTADASSAPGITMVDSDQDDSDTTAKIYANATATGTGAEVADMYFQAQATGTLTTFMQWDGSAQQMNIQGGQIRNVTTVNAATYDLLVSDYILNVTYTATGAVTSLTLPTAQCVAGRTIHIVDAGGSAGTNNITIDTGGSETISGNATKTLNTNYQSVSLYSDGSNWFQFN